MTFEAAEAWAVAHPQYFGRHRARHTAAAAVVRVLAFLLAVSR
jgi:hypothetical protein